jgi:hypothetical protein
MRDHVASAQQRDGLRQQGRRAQNADMHHNAKCLAGCGFGNCNSSQGALQRQEISCRGRDRRGNNGCRTLLLHQNVGIDAKGIARPRMGKRINQAGANKLSGCVVNRCSAARINAGFNRGYDSIFYSNI